MAENKFQVLQEKFNAVGKEQGEIVRRLALAVSGKSDACAASFLEALVPSIENIKNDGELWGAFLELSEQRICGGSDISPETILVRVVPAVGFLFYYSRKFIMAEEKTRRDRIRAELEKIRALLRGGKVNGNLHVFLDDPLNLTGRLRRRGHPLWFTTQLDVEDCSEFAQYVEKLTLGDQTEPPLFRFDVGLHHLGATPNVRHSEPDHNPDDTMMVYLPTVVDGMYHQTFIEGGTTKGGAREYVSRLDNTDAIDSLEMIE